MFKRFWQIGLRRAALVDLDRLLDRKKKKRDAGTKYGGTPEAFRLFVSAKRSVSNGRERVLLSFPSVCARDIAATIRSSRCSTAVKW